MIYCTFVVFKQKTACELRISDWSSDLCSSDLLMVTLLPKGDRSRASHDIAVDLRAMLLKIDLPAGASIKVVETPPGPPALATLLAEIDRTSGGSGKSVSVREDLAGRRIIKKKKYHKLIVQH